MADYRPISCVEHERLEFAALRRLPVSLLLADGRRLNGQVLDVYTRDGAEWLRLRDALGVEQVLRLDEITQMQEQPGPMQPEAD